MNLSIAAAILEATQVLRRAGVPEARREAGGLLASILGQDRTYLITHAGKLLGPAYLETFREHVARRAHGEPLQYITGHQDFFGLDFDVTRDVLIPRPETELLVETALDLIGEVEASPLICDIGAGSGCIAIALLHERPRARAIGVDISEAALQVATRNAARHGVKTRAAFVVADCLSAFQGKTRFDLIVSNPPYVAERELAGLQREVREHEPVVALTPGTDGLALIRKLLTDTPAYLVDGGYLLMEIGFNQRRAVEGLIDPSVWTLLGVPADLQGIPRTVVLQRLARTI